ncbi:hypothetical protein [Lacimicrobium alkaliphilum]|uniref:Lipoprotein n=1 Tax=Lacimicrobium alkaliphilum TaxID=1526571 RepID=A0ABQ1RFL6_9ALTE|nr:hypothetical protein [Lacimicrobium alkaliphilum]GGD68893.1 hypothetical protein GCM10011357_24960 [Lacimicrobium alkaliphilum]
MKTWIFIPFLLIVTVLTACTEAENTEGVGKYGMMEEGTPEYAAIKFFDHLYHDDNIERVKTLSSERMDRLLDNYRTNRNFQRHVINLPYDKVEMQIDSGNSNMRSEFSDQASITIFFTGELHNETVQDLRTVNLTKVKGEWLVDEIEADKFL